ncbi:hypothetical protein FA13DRAFT_1810489 [Coprinellus micaceus]|uniref:VCBS repeat-containing protein n=1 Tax=Coprinellus micaceus TaxID=71717 RepID=A0A4Y7TT06_COPMI|nr:hypothetical protein FA13DRAFT_1810489 [Coprinellus micaceus]
MWGQAIITQNPPVPADRAGTADIIGFGQDGIVILRNSVNPDIRLVIRDYGYNARKWRVEKHVRRVGDTTGNNRSDIIGFGDAGVIISFNNGDNTFSPQVLALRDFGKDAGNWTNDKHIRYVSDLRKKGTVYIIGFGDVGIVVSLNNGNGTLPASRLALPDFGYNAGNWRIDRHLRFLADTTVVGFGDSAVIVATGKGDGTFNAGKAVISDFAYSAGGWRVEKHPRTVSDLTGGGTVDVVGLGDAGVVISLNNGDVDVTGDDRGDIVGFANAGVYVALNNGDGTFAAPKLVLNNFGFDQGWRVDKHPRYFVDLTGDGRADVIGFGNNFVLVPYNDGKGNFGPTQKLTDRFAFKGGEWAVDKTVRWVANLAWVYESVVVNPECLTTMLPSYLYY